MKDKTKGNSHNSTVHKAVASVMLITVIAKVLGFAREIFSSYFLGATGLSDAYMISSTIPTTIFQFVGVSLTICFLPVYIELVSTKGRKEGNRFINSVLTLILMLSVAVIVLVSFFTDGVVNIFATGFEEEIFKLAVFFTKISIYSLLFSAFTYVFSSLLQANDCFSINAASVIPYSLTRLVFIVLGAKIHIMFLPVGCIVASLAQMLFMLPSAKKNQFRLKPNITFRSSEMKKMYILLMPVVIGASVNEINVLVDKNIASQVAIGGISALTYADSLIMFVQGIFAQTIASVYYPAITRQAKENNKQGISVSIDNALSSMLFFLIPITIGCLLLSKMAVGILYGRGAFDSTAIDMTSTALTGYSLGLVGYGIREVLARVFYAMEDSKTPTKNAAIGVVINIIFNVFLSRRIGIGGLALATSISATCTAMLLLLTLRRRKVYVPSRGLIIDLLKMCFSSALMGLFVKLSCYIFAGQGTFFCFIASVLVGAVIYFVLCLALKIDIMFSLIHTLKYKIISK